MHVWLPNKWVYFFNGCCNDSIVIDSFKNIKTINVLFTFGESQDFIHLYIGIKNTRQSLFVLYAIFICSVNDGITYGPLKETWKLFIHIIHIFWKIVCEWIYTWMKSDCLTEVGYNKSRYFLRKYLDSFHII